MNREINFNEIYNEFQPKIINYLLRLTGQHEAEDVAQEVFEKVNRGLKSFKGDSKLSTWLYRIATNTAIDRMKSSSFKRSSGHISIEDIIEGKDRNVLSSHKTVHPDQAFIRKEMSECVREFIDRLPHDYKVVLILKDYEGFTNKEIASILQITLDTVKIRLHRARTKLKNELNAGCDFYYNEDNVLACDRKSSEIMPKMPK